MKNKKDKPDEYWLITVRTQWSQNKDNYVTDTDVYDTSPFDVFLDGKKEPGVYDVHILFATPITKDQYDDYIKWEDSL